jgi:hypothetical protein
MSWPAGCCDPAWSVCMIGEFSGAETGDPAQAQHSNSASTSEATVLLTHPTLLLASCETLFFLGFKKWGYRYSSQENRSQRWNLVGLRRRCRRSFQPFRRDILKISFPSRFNYIQYRFLMSFKLTIHSFHFSFSSKLSNRNMDTTTTSENFKLQILSTLHSKKKIYLSVFCTLGYVIRSDA